MQDINPHKSLGPDGQHRKVLRDQADIPSTSFSISFEMSWRLKKVSDNWRKANFAPIFKTWQKQNPGNDGPVGLTSISGKVKEGVLFEHILGQVREKEETGDSQHRLTK